MTKQEMETAIINLQKQVANLAERTSNRDNTNESNISNVKSETNSSITQIEEAVCDNYTEQSATNEVIEEALIELYEMIEGGN